MNESQISDCRHIWINFEHTPDGDQYAVRRCHHCRAHLGFEKHPNEAAKKSQIRYCLFSDSLSAAERQFVFDIRKKETLSNAEHDRLINIYGRITKDGDQF